MLITESLVRRLIRESLTLRLLERTEGEAAGEMQEVSQQASETGYHQSGSSFWSTYATAAGHGDTGFGLSDKEVYMILGQYFKKLGVNMEGGGQSQGMRKGDMRDQINFKKIYDEHKAVEKGGVFLKNLVKQIEEVTQDPHQYISATIHIIFCNFDQVVKAIAKVYKKVGAGKFVNTDENAKTKWTSIAETYFAVIKEVVNRVEMYREKKGLLFDFYKNLKTYEGYDWGGNSDRKQERQRDIYQGNSNKGNGEKLLNPSVKNLTKYFSKNPGAQDIFVKLVKKYDSTGGKEANYESMAKALLGDDVSNADKGLIYDYMISNKKLSEFANLVQNGKIDAEKLIGWFLHLVPNITPEDVKNIAAEITNQFFDV